MKVLHVYRTYFPDPPGGLQEAIRQIALASREFGVETRVFALSPRPDPAEIGRPEGRVSRARSWAAPASCDLGGLSSLYRFRELVAWADIVHYHFPWPFADLLRLMAGGNKPSVMTYHSDIIRQRWFGRLYAPLMRHTLRRMDAVVATSPAYATTSDVLKRLVPAARLKVIPLGISESAAERNAGVNRDILQRFGLEEERYFLALGVLRYYKGFHYLLQAAPQVDAKVVIAGAGAEEERLRDLAKKLGVTNVIFTGQISDEEKNALLRGCRAFVLPSHLRSEAFGMVLVEAALNGKPMISCEIGTGTSYVNKNGVTGLVVAPESPQQLAEAMNQLLHDDPLVEHMGSAARQRYEQLFSGPALGTAYHALYTEIIRAHQGIE